VTPRSSRVLQLVSHTAMASHTHLSRTVYFVMVTWNPDLYARKQIKRGGQDLKRFHDITPQYERIVPFYRTTGLHLKQQPSSPLMRSAADDRHNLCLSCFRFGTCAWALPLVMCGGDLSVCSHTQVTWAPVVTCTRLLLPPPKQARGHRTVLS
jgi:hypothetical protein